MVCKTNKSYHSALYNELTFSHLLKLDCVLFFSKKFFGTRLKNSHYPITAPCFFRQSKRKKSPPPNRTGKGSGLFFGIFLDLYAERYSAGTQKHAKTRTQEHHYAKTPYCLHARCSRNCQFILSEASGNRSAAVTGRCRSFFGFWVVTGVTQPPGPATNTPRGWYFVNDAHIFAQN